MNKKVRNLIIGGVVLLLLVGVLLLLLFLPQKEEESSSETSSSAVSTSTVQIYTGETDKVSSIKVDGPKGTYEVKREATDMYTIDELEGFDQLNDGYKTLVSQFVSVTATRLVEENPSDIAKYGLDNPLVSVEVSYSDGTAHTVRFGNSLPTNDGYYVLVDDDKTVYAVANGKYTAADKGMLEYVSTQMISPWTAPTDEDGNATQQAPIINYLEIEGATFAEDGIFRMEAITAEDETQTTYSSGYRIVSPIEADFKVRSDSEGNDQNAVYTEKFADYSAEHVADVNPDETALTNYGFDDPYAVIRFARDGEEHVWTVGGEVATTGGAEGRYVLVDDRPVVYVCAVVNMPWLTADLDNLFSTLMVLPNINDVDRIEITAGGKSYEITTTGSDDELIATMNGTELDTAIYRKLYQYLLSAPAEEINRGNERGEKVAGITYHYKDTSKSDEVIEFYDIGNRRCVISLNGKDTYVCRSVYTEVLAKNCEKVLNGEKPILDY